MKVLYVPHCLHIGLNVGYSPQSAIICPSHVKREKRQRIDVAALQIHPGARRLRYALAALLSRRTLVSHCAAVCVGTGTRTGVPKNFVSYVGADLISSTKVKTTLLSVY